MARLNLTLDEATFGALDRDARKEHVRLATHARRLLREALSRREKVERQRKWAEGYRQDRGDTQSLLRDLEAGQLEVMGDEEDDA